MRRIFIFDFDDTLANYSTYNTLVYKMPVKILPPLGGLKKGVPEVLDFLKSKGDDLYLVTMNIVMKENEKWEKMDRVGIRRWFDERKVFMVREKTPEIFKKICQGRDPASCYVVGDSYTYDIKTGLSAGLKVLFIPRPIYMRRYPIPRNDKNNLTVLRSISEIMDRYDEL